MATVEFLAGEGFNLYSTLTSGLGFYGTGGFGYAVPLNEYQDYTYITNGVGTIQAAQCDNVKYHSANSGTIGSITYNLKDIPNYQSTLNIRLTNGSAITTQNGRVYIYDRYSKVNGPSGVTCQIAEIRHTGLVSTGLTGLGSTSWTNAAGTSSYLNLTNSPGLSGFATGSAVQHDWYLAISASPTSIGAKTQFGLLFEVEYL